MKVHNPKLSILAVLVSEFGIFKLKAICDSVQGSLTIVPIPSLLILHHSLLAFWVYMLGREEVFVQANDLK